MRRGTRVSNSRIQARRAEPLAQERCPHPRPALSGNADLVKQPLHVSLQRRFEVLAERRTYGPQGAPVHGQVRPQEGRGAPRALEKRQEAWHSHARQTQQSWPALRTSPATSV
jgi:hypothetical protein